MTYPVRFAAVAAVVLAALRVNSDLQAAPFQNLDFEQAQVVINDPIYGLLDAELAAPGWQVPGSTLYYGTSHLGMVSGIMLGGPESPKFNPQQVAGEYSMMMWGGTDPDMPSEASISQTGDIPAWASALELLVAGDAPILTLNGQPIPLFKVEELPHADRYAGDIRAFAGLTAELGILYAQSTTWLPETEFEGPMLASNAGTIDNIEFTTRVVPEPAAGMLAILGLAGLLLIKRRRHSSGQSNRPSTN